MEIDQTKELLRKDGEFNEDLIHNIWTKSNEEIRAMLESSSPAELRDNMGSTLLHYSAKYGNVTMTKYFIEKGCDVEDKDNDGRTPLMLAVDGNYRKTVDVLLEAGANIYEQKFAASDPLLKELIGTCKVVDKEKSDIYVLFRQEILKNFLRKVAEDFAKDTQAMAQLLLEYECPLHHLICAFKNTEVTRYYLRSGYLVDATEPKNNFTPLFLAVKSDDLANIKLLLEKGANVNARDKDGKNVLFHYDSSKVDSAEKLEILRILLKSKVSLTLQDKNGVSPIEKLLCDAQEEVVHLLLPYVNPLTKYGTKESTVLHLLLKNQLIEDIGVFKLFEKQYFDVHAKDSEGNTAINIAVVSEQPKKVNFLLRKGADINEFDVRYAVFKKIIYGSSRSDDQNYDYFEILELYLIYGGDLHKETTVFELSFNSFRIDDSNLQKILIAHLALLETCGHKLHEGFGFTVNQSHMFLEILEDFQSQLLDMKSNVVYGYATMFDLVTASDKQLTRYAANGDLLSKCKILCDDDSYSELYYYKYLKKRMDRAVDIVNHECKASAVLFEITGISQYLIIDKILDYLKISDLRNLSFVP